MTARARACAIAAAIACALGVVSCDGDARRTVLPGAAPPQAASDEPLAYTCSMHPQVRLAAPGSCPICGMDLVPARSAQDAAGGQPSLALSEQALAMASVETAPVERRVLTRELRAVGKIQYNEASLATVTARVDGYVERLFVDFTGVEIRAGDHLAEIYSPELLVAQQELLIAVRGRAGASAGPLVETAEVKLRRLGLTREQIRALVEKQQLTERVTLYSPIAGTVIEKSIVQNSAFRAGDALYRVANLDTVWVYLDIYEYDLAWVRYGQRVEVTAEALPGRPFEGRVTFVQPVVSEETRTIRIPVQVPNPDHALKPGMFVSAVIHSVLAADGQALPSGVEGKFSCPMHTQVLRDEPGACPVCGMSLVQIPGGLAPGELATPGAEAGAIAVPVTAVLDSGNRRIAYVEHSRGLFEPREIQVGPRAGDFYPVLGGLAEGERVVTRGGFLIDSQFQISGLPSLFYPGGLLGGPAGHAHGNATPSDSSPPPKD